LRERFGAVFSDVAQLVFQTESEASWFARRCAELRGFYSKIYADLERTVKGFAPRAPVTPYIFPQRSVRSLYDAIGASMRHIATKLNESPTDDKRAAMQRLPDVTNG
jgi:hypothetical protein